MSTIYLDTSVVVSLLVNDEHTVTAAGWFKTTAPALVISTFVKLEFAATISRHVRSGRLSEAAATRTLTFFDNWASDETRCLDVLPDDVEAANRIVRNFATKLAGPDAIHLAIVSRTHLPIATFDRRLADAARQYAVPVVVPV